MPTRLVREGIVSSEKVNSLSWAGEVFYRRLLSVIDDYGRYSANPKMLRAACYPLKLDTVSDGDVGKWLEETRKAALVNVYQVEGKRFLAVLNFGQQVRAKKSKWPDPPSSDNRCEQVLTVAPVVEVVDEVEIGDGIGLRKNGARHATVDDSPVVQTLPLRDGSEFPVRQSLVAELEPLYPAVDVPSTLNEMKGWLVLNVDRRKTRSGIRRFIGNWLQSEQAKHGG